MGQGRIDLSRDPTASVACHYVDDRFVPLRAAELIAPLSELCAERGHARGACQEFIGALRQVIAQEAAAFQQYVGDEYAAFNPDRDTLPAERDAQQRTPAGYAALEQTLAYLLEKANYERVDPLQLNEAVRLANTRGVAVKLDPQRVARLAVFVRGHGQREVRVRSWRKPLQGTTRVVPLFRRLVVVARLCDDPHVLIKVFKDILVADVEALLPHADVTMSWTDRAFMIGGGVGAVGSTALQVVKILSAGLLAVSRLLWVLTFGLGMLLWRTFSGYRSARQRRDSQRTRHLYFQNVANNAGALHVLIDASTQEEFKEAAVAYLLLLATRDTPQHEAQLDRQIEAFLLERFGVHVNFDCADALESLSRLGLLQAGPGLRVLPPEVAARRLREHWQARRSEDYHRQCLAARRASSSAALAAPSASASSESAALWRA